jgi:hypothetical protein
MLYSGQATGFKNDAVIFKNSNVKQRGALYAALVPGSSARHKAHTLRVLQSAVSSRAPGRSTACRAGRGVAAHHAALVLVAQQDTRPIRCVLQRAVSSRVPGSSTACRAGRGVAAHHAALVLVAQQDTRPIRCVYCRVPCRAGRPAAAQHAGLAGGWQHTMQRWCW